MSHCVGDSEDVGLVCRVILVLEKVPDHAGRRGGHKRFFDGHALERGFEVGNVALNVGVAAPGDGFGTHWSLDVDREAAAIDLRKIGRFDLRGRDARLAPEARDPLGHIRGVANLADFAVVDHVDLRVHLLANDLLHCCRDALVEHLVALHFLLVVPLEDGHQIVRDEASCRCAS